MKTKKETPIRFTGKTAYGLLSHIKRLILEEPLRYNQGEWLVKQANEDQTPNGLPKCGTVACIAGWTLTSLDEPIRTSVGWDARDILGLVGGQYNELFLGGPIHRPDVQSKEYAELGAEHISRFQAKYKKQLLAKKVHVNQ